MFHYTIGRGPKIHPPRHSKSITYRIATLINCSSWVMRIELVADFAQIGDGNGGYWEDQGYEWWAGV